MNRKLYTATFLLLLITGLADASVGKKANNGSSLFPVDGKTKASSRKNVLKLYPNPSYNGTITVSSQAEEKLNFYIFDLNGTLLHRAVLSNKQKQTFRNLEKGIYMYDAFLNDQGVEHGKIVVK